MAKPGSTTGPQNKVRRDVIHSPSEDSVVQTCRCVARPSLEYGQLALRVWATFLIILQDFVTRAIDDQRVWMILRQHWRAVGLQASILVYWCELVSEALLLYLCMATSGTGQFACCLHARSFIPDGYTSS